MLDFQTPFAIPNLVMFVVLFVRPAYQTHRGLQTGQWRGRWAQYWIGLSFLGVIFLVVKPIVETTALGWIGEILVALLLAYDNGALVRAFANSVVFPIYVRMRRQGGMGRKEHSLSDLIGFIIDE